MPATPRDLAVDRPQSGGGRPDMSNWKPAYAGYPETTIREFYVNSKGETKTRAVKYLLWGDWMLVGTEKRDGLVEAYSRGEVGYVDPETIQDDRLLEIVFVDIGQGDGCLVVTPDDKHIVIDAGEADNMYRFLNWRYGRFKKPFEFDALVISHPDQDHYGGFREFFQGKHENEKNIKFKRVYHNGIVERAAKDSLGRKIKVDGKTCIRDLVPDTAALADFLSVKSRWKNKNYPTLLQNMTASGRVGEFQALSVADGHLPGYGANKRLRIEVLGPVLQEHPQGVPCLRWLGSVGKTKNGHSVVLKLTYDNVRILLGGDLNIPAEHRLLQHHTGLASPPKTAEDHETLVQAAREVFQVDIAKACHHGSADFTSLFLEALQPIATVISSGDDESHAHPRAETLGAIGLASRGPRPLIFSTELARSSEERIKRPSVVRKSLLEAAENLSQVKSDGSTESQIERAEKKLEKLVAQIERSVSVYGAINVRTDGKRVVIAQRLEDGSGKWDKYRLEPQGSSGVLGYVAKHH